MKKPNYNPDDLLTAKELAKRWKCDVQSLAQHRYMKSGPKYIKAVGCGIRYKFQDIMDYENDHKKGG